MSVLKVLYFPNERLRIIAQPVLKIDTRTQSIIDDMFDTMYSEEGIGLAATQVDIHQCIVVIDISKTKNTGLVLINPIILNKSDNIITEEGCLSIPKQRALVSRSGHVKVKAIDRHGVYYELEADGLLSICIQHEIDHLFGKLFIDYLSPMKRQRIRQKLQKFYRQQYHH
ncbi:peptide deformylase [Candidatus Erwinia haradaeae]|uniref:Peptide deformylase n=1 Tax=Candidatus Erwinia haradaeae TaxID=1922217 RepID=A0A451DK71_9GAMM|nr:peptide deformylase [Candidatus Erwinia haradaeae]VFP87119.1 Peptide deformylase [Candidatus Erwinia haradaeae]